MQKESSVPLSLEKIAYYLSEAYQDLIQRTVIFDSLPSTNTYLLERVKQNDKSVLICLAEKQTMGRGRFNRQWLSSVGCNICLSLLWPAPFSFAACSPLSLVVALAVVRALKISGIDDGIGLKWPNDILWQGKKLAGILLDTHQTSEQLCEVVIGIGLNVGQSQSIQASIPSPITDLFEITGKQFDRNQLIAVMIESLLDILVEWTKKGFAIFIPEWLSHDVALNQPIQLLVDGKTLCGIYRGIDFTSGALLLEDAQGVLHHYLSGGVSLRFATEPTKAEINSAK